MKSISFNRLVLSILLSPLTVQAQDTIEQNETKLRTFSLHEEALTADQYFASIDEVHAKQDFPPLSFGGALGLEWGTTVGAETELLANSSNTGIGGKVVLLIESKSDAVSRLVGIKRIFATEGASREFNLEHFLGMKQVLMKHYGYPTHPCRPEQDYLGADAFLQGLEDQYRYEWHGSGAVVSLCVSDTGFIVETRKPYDEETLACLTALCQ